MAQMPVDKQCTVPVCAHSRVLFGLKMERLTVLQPGGTLKTLCY